MLITQFDDVALETYNALEDPDDAILVLEARGTLDATLEEFLAISEKHDMVDGSFGLLLLHRHFAATRTDYLLETPGVAPDGTPALITAPAPHRNDAFPSRWAVVDGEYVPLEYSVDPGVRRNVDRLREAPEFLQEVAQLLQRNRVEDLLGFAIAGRDLISITDDELYSEDTFDHGSVVVAKLISLESSKSVPTIWVAERGLDMACRTRCKTMCTKYDWGHGKAHSAGGHHPM